MGYMCVCVCVCVCACVCVCVCVCVCMCVFSCADVPKELKEVEFCVKGWNWWEVSWFSSQFMVRSKPTFEFHSKKLLRYCEGKRFWVGWM